LAAGLALCVFFAVLGYTLPGRSVPAAAPAGLAWVPVIDAGHGGEDGGAVSKSGILESEINLPIALKTELVFRFIGVKPIMTRYQDISIHDEGIEMLRAKKRSDLRNRVRIVSETPNSVLVSIHQNKFRSEQSSGAQVFYNENPQSQTLASSVQDSLRKAVDPGNRRGIKKASGIYIMENVKNPAILVECGFLSNSAECAKLQRDDYQTKLALAIAAGFVKAERAAGAVPPRISHSLG
jgi:N-acetylmuramoyl-L-alanine amidase